MISEYMQFCAGVMDVIRILYLIVCPLGNGDTLIVICYKFCYPMDSIDTEYYNYFFKDHGIISVVLLIT